MSHRLLTVLASAVLVFAVGACSEPSEPSGTPGIITITATLDTSGNAGAPDVPLAGLGVRLFRDTLSQPVAELLLNAQGVATFTDVPPGVYTVVPFGNVPEGAALASSSRPTVTVTPAGNSTNVSFRFVLFPGSVTGQLFRDENGNMLFDAGVDVAAPNVTVYVRADTGGSVPGAILDSTRTDSTGTYRFPRLRPGNYFIQIAAPSSLLLGTANLFRITVGARNITRPVTRFVGSPVQTAAQIRAQSPNGQTVALVGRLTTTAGTFSSGGTTLLFLQDASGALPVLIGTATDSVRGALLGEQVQVVGTLSRINGVLTLSVAPQNFTRLGGTPAPVAPRASTGSRINSRADEALLVRIPSVRVVEVPAGSSPVFVVKGVDAAGDTVRILVANSDPTLNRADFAVGNRLGITGIAIADQPNNVGPVTTLIRPRNSADVVTEFAVPMVARVIINELMPNPQTVADAAGEYIELFNFGNASQNLRDFTIRDNFGVDTIKVDLVIPAGGYLLLALNADTLVNGKLRNVDYVYKSTIALGNNGDRVVLKDPAGVTIDSVAFATAAGAVAGVARGVRDPSADNTDVLGANWAVQTTIYNTSGTLTDMGTPRAQNDGFIAPPAPSPAAQNSARPAMSEKARASSRVTTSTAP